jgi:putative two-component system response regulator
VALTHHERWDGTGYLGLSGEQIPQSARIVSVADVYDALTSVRPYKSAWTHEQAMDEITSLSGSHFDPKVVDAFLETMQE